MTDTTAGQATPDEEYVEPTEDIESDEDEDLDVDYVDPNSLPEGDIDDIPPVLGVEDPLPEDDEDDAGDVSPEDNDA